jgi:uncharacterized membrane protein
LKKIKDERLIIQNLKNIRIAYIIQTIGILGILGYDLVSKGLEEMRGNPLWLVFMITSVISAYLSMNISADQESNKINPKKSLSISVVVLGLIAMVVGFLVSMSEGFTIINGIIMGGILFICGVVPIIYIFNLRTKRQDDNFEE